VERADRRPGQEKGYRPERGGRDERGSGDERTRRPSSGDPRYGERPRFGGDRRSGADRAGAIETRREARGGVDAQAGTVAAGTTRPAPRRPRGPQIPEDVTGRELDPEVRQELLSLTRDTGRQVARHLVMTGELIDEDPEAAWAHADAARKLAGRIGVVREAAGLAAYRSGRYDVALAELRTARRLTGSSAHLPVMADCERGLGRPERALALLSAPEARTLDRSGQVELLIVAAGARADLGQLDAAVVTLQVPQLNERVHEPWLARLRSAYADALAAVGREEESLRWLRLAAEVDEEGVSGAADRLAELEGVTFLEEPDDEDDLGAEDLAEDELGDEGDDCVEEGSADAKPSPVGEAAPAASQDAAAGPEDVDAAEGS
jgi:tetratricopeptide (TPR) repeat protein